LAAFLPRHARLEAFRANERAPKSSRTISRINVKLKADVSDIPSVSIIKAHEDGDYGNGGNL
jgi:hypothetical protein